MERLEAIPALYRWLGVLGVLVLAGDWLLVFSAPTAYGTDGAVAPADYHETRRVGKT